MKEEINRILRIKVLLMRYQLDINSCLEFILDTYLDDQYITRDENENITAYDLSHVEVDGLTFKEVYANIHYGVSIK